MAQYLQLFRKLSNCFSSFRKFVQNLANCKFAEFFTNLRKFSQIFAKQPFCRYLRNFAQNCENLRIFSQIHYFIFFQNFNHGWNIFQICESSRKIVQIFAKFCKFATKTQETEKSQFMVIYVTLRKFSKICENFRKIAILRNFVKFFVKWGGLTIRKTA